MTLPLINVWEIHPILVHFPIAFFLAGMALEVVAVWRPGPTVTRAAAGLLLAGAVFGWLTAAAGLLAFFTVPAHTEQAHTLMLWHLGFALVMLVLFTGVAIVRWRRRDRVAAPLALLVGLCAALLLIVTGYLGGVIVYHGGAGIEPELLAEEIREGHHHGDGHPRHGHDSGQDGSPEHHGSGKGQPGEAHQHSHSAEAPHQHSHSQ